MELSATSDLCLSQNLPSEGLFPIEVVWRVPMFKELILGPLCCKLNLLGCKCVWCLLCDSSTCVLSLSSVWPVHAGGLHSADLCGDVTPIHLVLEKHSPCSWKEASISWPNPSHVAPQHCINQAPLRVSCQPHSDFQAAFLPWHSQADWIQILCRQKCNGCTSWMLFFSSLFYDAQLVYWIIQLQV